MGSSIVQQNSFSSDVLGTRDVTGSESLDISNKNKNENEINAVKENQNKKTLITEDEKIDLNKPESATGSVYRVQLIAVSKVLESHSYFSKINYLIEKYGMSIQTLDNLNKYQLGNFNSKREADEIKEIIIKQGYKGCFIVKVEQ